MRFTPLRRPGRRTAVTSFVVAAAVLVAISSCSGSDGPTAVAVTSLRFVSQPDAVIPGAAFGVTVELLRSSGARATSAKDQVTISVGGDATISGPATVAAVAGLATFDGLVVSGGAATVQLTATSGGLAVSGAPLPYHAGPAALEKSVVNPAPCSMVVNSDAPLVFTFNDAIGNPKAAVPVTLSTSLVGATFSPSSGVTSGTGTFATTLRMTATGSATISATVDGTPITFAAPFVAVNAPAAPPPTLMAFPGTATGALSAVCLSSGSSFATYQFAVLAQTGAAFSVTAPFDIDFGVRLNATSNDVTLTDTPPSTVEWLLPPGTYLYSLHTTTTSGTYSLQGAAVAGNSAATGRVLVTGGTYSGQKLEMADFQFGDGSSYDIYLLRTTAPCTLTLKSSAFNPYFVVIDDITNALLGIVEGSGVGVDAVITLPHCASGGNPIAIFANSLNAGESGAYTLVVNLTGPPTIQSLSAPMELTTPIPMRAASSLGRMLLERPRSAKPTGADRH